MEIIGFLTFVVILIVSAKSLFNSKKSWASPKESFPTLWRVTLSQKVAYYNALNDEEKLRFEFKIQEFLLNCRVTGIKVAIDETDKLLVAASAIIPIFKFPKWRYTNLYEVLLYPGRFNEDFETEGPDRNILGMVGTGYMEGVMVLSKQALHKGFENESDKKNTAIHEFVHLIDKMDGTIDGIPEELLEKQYVIPWIDLIGVEIEKIRNDKSDINPYGGTNKQEFFAVISEYFFERPKLLERKHPQLYGYLEKIFNQKMNKRVLARRKVVLGRNSPCPCNSGLKFKRCCGKE